MNVELVGVHSALHHRFTKAVAGRDENHVFETTFGVNGEHHTGRAQVGAHHTLHTRRQGNVGMRKTFVDAVADGAVVVEAGKNLFHFVQHIGDAHHIEEGFLLPCKAGVGQVFGRGRRAHGE